jgi:putative glycerol kinase 5
VDIITGPRAYSSFHGNIILLILSSIILVIGRLYNYYYLLFSGLYPVVAWKYGKETVFALEGTEKGGGCSIEWAIDLGFLSTPNESQEIAESVSSTNGVYFVPAFSGVGHPFNDDTATGTLIGLKRETKKPHIVRSILECIAFRVFDIFSTIESDLSSHIKISTVKLDGGVSNNSFVVQSISDMIQKEIDIRK